MRATWAPDVLGPGFEQTTIELQPDAEGEAVATLVRPRRSAWRGLAASLAPLADVDVLYVHGWSDYFFQTELAERWERLGARFHALDLRKYGRSLRDHQTPGYTHALGVYDEDIEQALRVMGHGEGETTGRRLVLMGHSTGGLTLSLWADRHPGRAAALVLNSPWLEFQVGAFGREALAPLMHMGARLRPRDPLPQVDFGYYTRTTSNRFEGEWAIDERWRPDRGFIVHPGWLAAIFEGQRRVAAGLSIDVPVLVLLSTGSTLSASWSEAMRTSDIVLNVTEVAEQALRLGPSVSVERVEQALHDVFLSPRPVRDRAWGALRRWAGGYLP